MADKLSEASWTGFTKKHKLDLEDGALVKALAAFDKTDESKPEPRLKALDEVIKQIPEQVKALAKRKKELGDKPFGEAKDKLYALLGAAESLHEDAAKAAADAKRREADAAGAGDEEEEDSPALLTTKMAPLVRQLRKGDVRLPALVCHAGTEAAVLISRRPISRSRRKLLAETLEATGGYKYAEGECYFEGGALHFALQGKIGGLAKKLRLALLGQVQARLKVRVHGDDGEQDEDGEDEGEGAAAGQTQTPTAPSAAQLGYEQRLRQVQERLAQALKAQHPESTKLRALIGYASEKADGQQDYAAASKALDMLDKLLGAPAKKAGEDEGKGAEVDPGAAFTARLAALMPSVKQAIAAAGASAQDIKLKVSEAGTYARKRDYDAAHGLLDEAEALLEAGEATSTTPEAGGGRPAGGTAAFVDYAKARLQWIDARKQVAADLGRLEKAIVEAYDREGPAEAAEARRVVRQLHDVLKVLDESLADKLDEGLNASDPARRAAINREAASIIDRYQRYLGSSPLLREIDDNPFVPVDVQERLASTLEQLEQQLT